MINYFVLCLSIFGVQCSVIPSCIILVYFTLCQGHLEVAAPGYNVSIVVYHKFNNIKFETVLFSTKYRRVKPEKSNNYVELISILPTRLFCTPMLFVSH